MILRVREAWLGILYPYLYKVDIMKVKCSIFFLAQILVLVCLLSCKQVEVNAQHSRIPVDRVKDGLKDSVKSVSAQIYQPLRDSVSQKEYLQKYAGWKTDLVGLVPLGLYARDGRFMLREGKRDSLTQPLDSMRGRNSIVATKYDMSDYYKKQQYKIPQNYPYQVYNPYQVFITKVNYAPIKRVAEENGYKYMDIFFGKYEYFYDQKGEKILKDIKYNYFDGDKDGIINYKDTVYITNYIYDKKDRLIRKYFDMSPLQRKSTFNALESESIYDHTLLTVPIWYVSWQEFEYDTNDNVTRYSLKYSLEKEGTREWIEYEDKYYYSEDNILTKIERIYPEYERSYPGQPMNTDKRILHYNDKGNLIKSEGIRHKTDTIAVTRTYTYEYDERDNWVRCNVYHNGNTDSGPHFYVERRIEYYNE